MTQPGDARTSGGTKGGVQSLARALALLDALLEHEGQLSIAELATLSELPMPTVHRLLQTLVAHGYVRQLPNRRYALGFKLIPLGAQANRLLSLGSEDVLRGLARELGETANLAVLTGLHAEYVAQAPSPHSMRMFTEVGRLVELHCTGVGKALLTRMTRDDIASVAQRVGLPRYTEYTVTDLDTLNRRIDAARSEGYVVDEQEQEIGVRCVAVPVPSSLPMAVSVSGPVTRMTPELVARAVPLLRAAAETVARRSATD